MIAHLRGTYPRTYRLLTRLINDRVIHPGAVEGLTHDALARIEGGETSERDARLLLMARSNQRRRGR